jgi:hypothetical protein
LAARDSSASFCSCSRARTCSVTSLTIAITPSPRPSWSGAYTNVKYVSCSAPSRTSSTRVSRATYGSPERMTSSSS